LVAALRRRGIDVYLGAPRTLDGVYQVVREVARRARRETAGEGLIAAARARAAGPSRGPDRPSPVTLFVYDCCDPPFTTGGATVLSDLITRAGGQNVFADLSAGWTHVSWEQVVARRPRLIVIDDYASSVVGLDKKRARLASIPSLAAVPVVTLPLGLALGGLGSVEALDRLRAFVSAVAGVER
jgi:iron complex transport system substrate-binding protein